MRTAAFDIDPSSCRPCGRHVIPGIDIANGTGIAGRSSGSTCETVESQDRGCWRAANDRLPAFAPAAVRVAILLGPISRLTCLQRSYQIRMENPRRWCMCIWAIWYQLLDISGTHAYIDQNRPGLAVGDATLDGGSR